MSKPFSEPAARNSGPILNVLTNRLKPDASGRHTTVLEIGSGTGQHAVYFASQLAHLVWQTSDRVENHEGISQWLDEAELDNVLMPLWLDVSSDHWPEQRYDVVYSANTVHIMSWPDVIAFLGAVGNVIEPGGQFMLYGPFRFEGAFTTESNADFDQWLKQQEAHRGIRDFEALDELAVNAGLAFERRYDLPANNHLLAWRKPD